MFWNFAFFTTEKKGKILAHPNMALLILSEEQPSLQLDFVQYCPANKNVLSMLLFNCLSSQGLLDLDGRNSQKYRHQTWAEF